MMVRGGRGVAPTDRRSRPARLDRRKLQRLRTVTAGCANGSAGCAGACRAMRARNAILRRGAARRARKRFFMTLLSGSALAALAGGDASIVTGGPPSVAIFVEAKSTSGEAGALFCSGAAGAASFAGSPILAGDRT